MIPATRGWLRIGYRRRCGRQIESFICVGRFSEVAQRDDCEFFTKSSLAHVVRQIAFQPWIYKIALHQGNFRKYLFLNGI